MNIEKLINKKLFVLIGILVSCLTFAIPKEPCEKPMDVCCEEAVGPFAFSYPKDVGLSCPRNFYLHGEFLWMKPSEEGLEYAIDQNFVNPGAPAELKIVFIQLNQMLN